MDSIQRDATAVINIDFFVFLLNKRDNVFDLFGGRVDEDNRRSFGC